MQPICHFQPEFRHATRPTDVVSYLFPALFVIYEVYRVSYWIAQHGLNFSGFKEMGYEFTLMLAVFLIQLAVEIVFLVLAWVRQHLDVEHRLANPAFGLVCSIVVLAFDYGLQRLA